MKDIFVYVLLGLVLILLVIVIIMMKSLARIRENIRNSSRLNTRNTELMEEGLRRDIDNVRESMNGLQTVMSQTMTQSYSTLNQTIDRKLQGSFDSINSYLQVMNKDIGEMKNIAGGIEDVKKVLTNVKTRGILGEIQLGAIFEDILAPSQYDTNVVTVPQSGDRVEFAVKFPSGDGFIYMPVDSKFPGDSYAHLLDAYDSGDENLVKAAKSSLLTQFKKEAKDIATKYIKIPYTTEFGIMFLPFEGLYVEAVKLGVIELLQRDYNITVAGPSTMAALLNSLQMGFRTLAIQENAEKVWHVLGNVKNEFDKFAYILNDAQDRLNKVNDDLDQLIGVRTRKIQKALSEAEDLEGFELSEE